ncbi:hypothetical protein [Burkholderia gladioli]|uniref:hypothetical protein n=1 Tax=Burkholderia gladioli TaxID=28095 RepID=UPI000BF0B7AB|nr:hypothetical protein [Burkholderia gladioli]PEH83733.1 hypothetical protein CRM95_01395 [Burkholderia gladioli]
MKNVVLLAMLVSSVASASSTQDVFVMTKSTSSETLSPDQYIYVLFKNSPCKLPIANASNMRKAAIFNSASPDIGCWGKTLGRGDADLVIIGPYGNIDNASLTEFYSAKLDSDGTGHITGRAMSLEKYLDNIKKSYHQ